jgi:hypothetical protein
MKKLLISIVTAAILGVPEAYALEINADKLKACETAYREKNRADKEAAPEGYKPSRPRGFRQAFIVECLSK